MGDSVWHWLSRSGLDWIKQCFTSPPTQYRLYGRRFLQVKRPNQQYQSTEGTNSTQTNQTCNKQTWTQNTASPLALVYNNTGWLGDGSHRGQGCQAWTAVGLPPRYPKDFRNRRVLTRRRNSEIQHGGARLADWEQKILGVLSYFWNLQDPCTRTIMIILTNQTAWVRRSYWGYPFRTHNA